MKHTEHNAFRSEAIDTINRIYKDNRNLTQLRWFLDTALSRFDNNSLNAVQPQVIVIGDDIPAEILYTVCDNPFYVVGGSLGTAHWADELTPRDTDPFSRSSLGWLINPEFDITENALIVTAVSSDSRRKMISLLKNAGRNIEALDVPPTNMSPNAVSYYTEQLVMLAEKIAKHTGKRFTGGNLKRAVKRIAGARSSRQIFNMTVSSAERFITDEAVILVNQCMYFADSLDEWSMHVSLLSKELESLCGRYAYAPHNKPKVLILGSPVVFPNYKVPQLIASAGMRVSAIADSLSLEASLAVPKARGFVSADSMPTKIAQNHLKMISSGARISNDGLFSYFMHLVKEHNPDGIVCHILKGQIEYDFELPRIEKAAEKAGIPVFRLETDYQYQDMEQLRIRMEAFGEMLTQRKIVQSKKRRTA